MKRLKKTKTSNHIGFSPALLLCCRTFWLPVPDWISTLKKYWLRKLYLLAAQQNFGAWKSQTWRPAGNICELTLAFVETPSDPKILKTSHIPRSQIFDLPNLLPYSWFSRKLPSKFKQETKIIWRNVHPNFFRLNHELIWGRGTNYNSKPISTFEFLELQKKFRLKSQVSPSLCRKTDGDTDTILSNLGKKFVSTEFAREFSGYPPSFTWKSMVFSYGIYPPPWIESCLADFSCTKKTYVAWDECKECLFLVHGVTFSFTSWNEKKTLISWKASDSWKFSAPPSCTVWIQIHLWHHTKHPTPHGLFVRKKKWHRIFLVEKTWRKISKMDVFFGFFSSQPFFSPNSRHSAHLEPQKQPIPALVAMAEEFTELDHKNDLTSQRWEISSTQFSVGFLFKC